MVWQALIAGGIQVIGNVIQGSQERQAADAANSENKKMIKARYERDKKEWGISFATSLSSYAWDVAETEAARYQDKVAETDYNNQQERVIDAALLNLDLNTEALYDQFGVSEELRAIQDNLTFDKGVDDQKLALGQSMVSIGNRGAAALADRDQALAGYDIDLESTNLDVLRGINNRKQARLNIIEARQNRNNTISQAKQSFRTLAQNERDVFGVGKTGAQRVKAIELASTELEKTLELADANLDFQVDNAQLQVKAAQSNTQSMQAAAGYMNSIKQRAAEADQIVRGKETEGQDIQEQIVIAERLDTIKRDAEYITAIVDGASTKASTVVRGGGSNSARRAAMDSMMAYGRSYGELQALQASRRTKLNNYNSDLVGATASQLSQIATAISGEADRIKYTSDNNALKNQGFQIENLQQESDLALTKLGIKSQARLSKRTTRVNYNQKLDELRQTRNSNVNKLQQNRDFTIEDAQLLAAQAIQDGQLDKDNAQLQIKDARLDKQGIRQQIKNTRQDYNVFSKGLKGELKVANKGYDVNTKYLLDNFNQLTVPGYELARREGDRQFSELVNTTYNTVEGAATPYRNAIIFDPLEPIAGLKPEKGMATKVQGPSWGSIAARSFMGGVRGAMSASYTDENGNLAFR